MNLSFRSFLFLITFTPLFASGQKPLSIKVMDSSSKAIIVNANLSVNKVVYYPSDENGNIHFDLQNVKKGDTLYISCIGYLTVKVVYVKESALPQEIGLNPIRYELNEVKIASKKIKQKEVTVGTQAFSISEVFTHANTKYALYINNKDKLVGSITEIRIHMRDGAKSIDMPFKIRLFSRKLNTKFPDTELMEEIIAQNIKRKSWFTVNISHLGISLPSDGFFIVFETMPSEYYSKVPTKIHGWSISRVPGLAFTTFPKNIDKDNYSLTKMGNNWAGSGGVEYQMQAKILLNN